MRASNLLVSVFGIAGVLVAAVVAWRWRNTTLLAEERPAVVTPGGAALDGLRTLAITASAGVLAGTLVPGLGGRLVMRILAATSGQPAQGSATAANEVVGEITNSGTLAVVVFVGILGGVLTALAFVVARRWLPSRAGRAGVVTGVLLLGTIGVGDAMSPDNRDFAILHPTWLAVALIVGIAMLFGVTFTALAARLDAGMPTLSRRPSSIASHVALIIYLLPLLFVAAAIYVGGRAVLRGRLALLIARPTAQRAGRTVVGVATIFAALASVQAITEIVSA